MYDGWTVADEGIVGGVQYVTVLDDGLNPIEYNMTNDEAEREYGLTVDANRAPV